MSSFRVAGMAVDCNNGLTPSYLRVLTAIGELDRRRQPITVRAISRLLGQSESTSWTCHTLRIMSLLGLVSLGGGTATIRPACRFYTYEQLNPTEEANGTAGDARPGTDGPVRAEDGPR